MSAAVRRPVTAILLAALVLATAWNCPGLGPRQWESSVTEVTR